MVTARYYRRVETSELGTGMCWFEFEREWAARQVEVYGDVWRWGDEANRRWLSEEPELELEVSGAVVIGAEEFEQAWEKARAVGSPDPEVCLTAKELGEHAEVWRALKAVVFDESFSEVKAVREEFFKRIPEDRLRQLMERLERYLLNSRLPGNASNSGT